MSQGLRIKLKSKNYLKSILTSSIHLIEYKLIMITFFCWCDIQKIFIYTYLKLIKIIILLKSILFRIDHDHIKIN